MQSELHEDQIRLLRVLALETIKRHGVDALLIDENDRPRDGRLARVGSVALVEQPADGRLPKRIDAYSVSGGEEQFKLDPRCLLYSLRYRGPKDFHLVPVQDPKQWFDGVELVLLSNLKRHDRSIANRLAAAGINI